jgi:hypothetical protein
MTWGGPFDLFGCGPGPTICPHRSSWLAVVLNGAKLVALTENTATIETRTGARQTYWRRSVSVGEILLACFSR